MALNLSQELEIVNGDIGPTAYDITTFVYQSAVGSSIDFLANVKDVDPVANEDAGSYVNKMTTIVRAVMRQQPETLKNLVRVLSSVIGDSAFTYAQISAGTDSQWEGFINNNIRQVMEIAGTVTGVEKTAYDNA